jgi:hypothetical protein
MIEDTPLSDILSDEPQAEAIEPQAEIEQPTETQSDGPVRDEKGRFAPKGETTEEPPSSPQEDEGPHVPRRALQDERSKRQQLEAELAQLRQQYAQPQPQAQQAQEQGPPDRWEDPDGYDQWLIGQAAQAARAEAHETYQRQRIEASAIEAMQRIPDYQEKIQVFEQMAAANPALMQEMIRQPNPAEYAYNMAKTQVDIQQYGGIDGLINARVQEALKAQQPANLADVASRLPSAPPSISSDRSVGARSGPAWGGPTPLSEIL